MLVLGGGPIGCELAQVAGRLGIEVKVVELLPRLLARDDSEASEAVRKRLVREGIEVATGTKAVRFEHEPGRTSVTCMWARPSSWKKRPPSKSRGVPGWSSVGQGQKTPICASIFSYVMPE